MVKKSPFSDKVITPEQAGESLVARGLRGCGTLSQRFVSPIKNAQFRKETGRLRKRQRINAWSTADAYAPCADRLSYARLHGRRE
ncbi:hypothetical protein EA796_07795 [Pseudomonas sp. AOB-7]|nr:hypothetical protein EA796_07795 [Pseudomonas sp. AOB-7]